jgi:spore germination cell wall hydrolase CwlJ-like protein
MHGPAPYTLSPEATHRGLSLLTPALACLILLTIAAIGALAVKGPRPADIIAGAGFETPPPSPPPLVEPLEVKAVAPDTARSINAAIPFVSGPHPAAKPFHLNADPLTTARATDCLASAIYYEAGNEAPEGQRAVAQVILNRMRHPAFPHSVCGVVYQGATRSTGCQFSFSCDGSMARLPSAEHWARLREMAREMLSGAVYAPVGLATHYHTDWVVPYWSAKLDKIRAERTHLFLRWTGWWGTPPAFRSAYAGSEPLIGRLARLSPAHATALAGEVALDAGGTIPGGDAVMDGGDALPATTTPVFASPAGNFLIYTVSPRTDAARLADMAKAACGTQPYCKVMMWTDPATTPSALPVSPSALDAMAFSYLRNEKGAFEKALWNCAIFRRDDPAQCMKMRVPVAAALPGKTGAATPVSTDHAPVSAAVDESELIPMARDEAPAADAPRKGKSDEGGSNLIRRRPGG